MGLEIEHFGRFNSSEPVVVATGTYNALATDAYRLWAFRRAELTAFVGSPFRLPSGNTLGFARVRQLDPCMVGGDRLVALAHRALDSVGDVLARVPTQARMGIALCLSERLDARHGDERGRSMRRRLESTIITPFVERGLDVTARSLTLGHASFGRALLDTGRMLESRKLDLAVILGVDSYYDPFVLEKLFLEERVLDSDWREAFVPGEAASVVVIARPDVARALGLQPMATVDSVATNQEVATRENDVGLLGLGLSRPAVAVMKRLAEEGRALDWWMSDATGETLRVQELTVAWPRAAHIAMRAEAPLDLLASHLGDIGAAYGTTAMTLGIEGLRRGDPDGTTCLITASSDGGERAVVLVTARPASA